MGPFLYATYDNEVELRCGSHQIRPSAGESDDSVAPGRLALTASSRYADRLSGPNRRVARFSALSLADVRSIA